MRLSLAESGLSVARATPLLFDKFIEREGIRGRRALDWFGAFVLTVGSWVWLLFGSAVRSDLRGEVLRRSDLVNTRYVQRRTKSVGRRGSREFRQINLRV